MKLARASIVAALSGLYFAYVFQLFHRAPFESGLGDWIDPYFINYLLEHWYRSVLSLSDPSSPPMYFPARHTLGYSHGLILYAPFYLAVRPFLHPFQADTISLFLAMETGSLFLYAVFRRFLRLGFVEALLLTAFFVSSQNVVQELTGIWSQRASVFLIPLILYVQLAAWRRPTGWVRLALAWAAGFLSALLFVQDSYTGEFALLMSLLLLAAGAAAAAVPFRARVAPWIEAVVSPFRQVGDRRSFTPPSAWWLWIACISLAAAMAIELHPLHRVRIAGVTVSADNPGRALVISAVTAGWFVVREFWPLMVRVFGVLRVWMRRLAARRLQPRTAAWLLAGLSGALMGGFVFLWIYLASYREHPGFPEEMVVLTLFDASKVRGLGGTVTSLVAFTSARSFELVLALAVLAWTPWLHVDRRTRIYSLWFVAISVLVLAIPVKFGDFSVWNRWLRPLPGAAAIRDPKRVIEVYELAVVLAAGLFLARLPGSSRFRRMVSALVLLLLVTQWNREVFVYHRPNRVFDQMVEAPLAIDASCQSFFIKGASPRYMSRSSNMWSLYAMDAMFIGLRHAIPTLNGYSAWAPPDWELGNPQESTYPGRVANWIAAHDLRGVCALDIETRTMTPYDPRQPPR